MWAPILYSRRRRNDFSILTAPGGLTTEELSWLELACGAATRGARFERGGRPAAFRRGGLTIFGAANAVRAIAGDAETVAWVGGSENFWFAGFCSRDVAATLPASYEFTPAQFQSHLELLRSRWDDTPKDRRTAVSAATHTFPPATQRGTRELNTDPHTVHVWPDTPSERYALWTAAIEASHVPDRDFAVYLGLLTRGDALQVAPDGSLIGRVFNATVRDVADPERLLIAVAAPVQRSQPQPKVDQPVEKNSRKLRRTVATVAGVAVAGAGLATKPKETIVVAAIATAAYTVRKWLRSMRGAPAEPATPPPAQDLASAYRRRPAMLPQTRPSPGSVNDNTEGDDWQ